MNHPINSYYIYTYKENSTSRARYCRLYKNLFRAHSAAEALTFNISLLEKKGFSRQDFIYGIIRKGTRQIAKARGLASCEVCTAIVNPWQWKEDSMSSGPRGIVSFLNCIDREWDKAEGKDSISGLTFIL